MASINIGETLREARIQQNISLDELQQLTKIQKRYLVALEYNDFDSVPGTFYVRAFIRQYADAVGLNGQALVDIFNGDLNAKLDDPTVKTKKTKKIEKVEISRSELHEEGNNGFLRSLPAILFSLFGLAIAVAVFFVTWQNRQAETNIKPNTGVEEITSLKSSEPATQESQSTSESTREVTPSSSSVKEVNGMKIAKTSEANNVVKMNVTNVEGPAKFTLVGKGLATWAYVVVNGVYVFQEVLQTGDTREVELPAATKNATVILGVAENFDLQLNGQAVEFLSSAADETRKTIDFTITYKQ